MINVTQDFIKAISKTSRTFIAKLLYQDTEIDCGIRALKIYKGACSNNAFLPGTVYSSYVDATIDITDHTLENKEIQLKIGLVLEDGSIEYVKMGYYTVISPKSTAYQTSFTAVGRINSKLNRIFEAPEVCSISNIANSITRTTGVTILFKGVEPAGTIEKSMVGMTCKEALGVITSVLGAFATEDNEGNVVVCKFNSEETYRVDGDRMTSLPEFNDFDYNLYGVKVIVSEAGQAEDGTTIEEASFSSGEPRMVLNNAYMTESLFNNFCNNIVGYTFRPGKVLLALGDPRIEPWDCMSVEDIKGNVFNVPCLNIVHTYDGGFNTEISAPGESETETSSAIKGPIVQQLERISAALLTVNSAILKRLKADEAELMYAKIESLNAINAEIEKLKTSIITTDYLEANYATIESLKATNATIENITVAIANMKDLIADKATIAQLEALDAYIKNLEADMLTATNADLKYATIKSLEATTAQVKNLDTKKANIDFANINEAAIKKVFSDSGIIKDLVVSEGKITGELVGVTIKGDLIEGNTVKADKLVVKGSNGIYYKLNFEGGAFKEGEAIPDDGLHGSVIVTNSITAEKIAVDDLVAFGATIGGFKINNNSIYSGVKGSATNTTRGVYFDNTGQFSVGDSSNFFRYYKDQNGNYKLEISAKSILIGTENKNVETILSDAYDKADNAEKQTVIQSNTAPEATTCMWLDIGVEPPMLKRYNIETSSWEPINDTTSLNNSIYELEQHVYAEIANNTESIMSTVSSQYYLKTEAEKLVSDMSTKITQTAEDLTIQFDKFNADLEEVSSHTDAEFEKIQKYIKFVDGKIMLGESGNQLMLEISNDRISFLQNKKEVAYFSHNKLYIVDGEFTNSLKLGNFAYLPRSNGNLSFKKI